MFKKKSTMKKRYIPDLLQQLLKNRWKSQKRLQLQATQQKHKVAEKYMVMKRCENNKHY